MKNTDCMSPKIHKLECTPHYSVLAGRQDQIAKRISDVLKRHEAVLHPFPHLPHEEAAKGPALKHGVITDTEPLGTCILPFTASRFRRNTSVIYEFPDIRCLVNNHTIKNGGKC